MLDSTLKLKLFLVDFSPYNYSYEFGCFTLVTCQVFERRACIRTFCSLEIKSGATVMFNVRNVRHDTFHLLN